MKRSLKISATESIGAAMSGPRVCVLVDDVEVRKPLVRALVSSGLTVYEGSSHLVRPAVVSRFEPDVVVIDLGDSGYGGDTPWRARPIFDALWPQQPMVVALDRFSTRETKERRDRLGPRATVEGPIDGSRVAVEVQRQLASRRSRLLKTTSNPGRTATRRAA